ncbi:hypothetical protein J4482_01210 [Candidatus Woesearchaeota archaeon]|nr:hypothetical protein [uncultured archaeon]AQS32033.1 hypothetical protein [uncultured archaeon]MBS3115226.1 hypothetical protein [Candidatus Woesearchaeota archaeon]
MTAAAATIPMPAGGLEQRTSVPSKSLEQKLQETKENVVNVMNKVDGFVGDTLKYGAASYSAGSVLPIVFLSPIMGLVYTTIVGSTTYIAMNMGYNFVTGSFGLAYKLIRHPVDTIGSVFRKTTEVVMHPFDTVKNIAMAPEKIFNYFFKGRNSNKYGKMLGCAIGGGLAFKNLAPETFGKLASIISGAKEAATSSVSNVVDRVKEGIEVTKEAVNKYYWNTLYLRNPIDSVDSAMSGLEAAVAR